MAEAKNQALIVTTRFPWPRTDGFSNKNFWLLKGLAPYNVIDLVVIQWRRIASEDMAPIIPLCRSIFVYRPTLFDVLYGLVYSLICDLPFQLALYHSTDAKKFIKKNKCIYNKLIVSVIRSAQYFCHSDRAVVYDLADSIGQLYERDSLNYRGIKKFVYREEGRRLKKYESHLVKAGCRVNFFNNKEVELYKSTNVRVVPHGVDPQLFDHINISDACRDGVVIFGKMDYQPNIYAVQWFCKNILPKIDERINLYVIGASPTSEIFQLASSNRRIKVLGFVDDPYPMIKGALASICPIQTGGGIQNKVIESMAIGAYCIISSLAAAPLSNIESSGLVICNTDMEWIDALQAVFSGSIDTSSNRKQSKNYALANFSWSSYCKYF